MDFLVLGDAHFKFKPNYRESGKNIGHIALDVVADTFKYAEARSIKYIIHLGDLTDKARPSEDTRSLLLKGFQVLGQRYPDITFHTLIGNHDVNRVVRYGLPYPNTAINNFNISLPNFNILALSKGNAPFILDDHTHIYALPYFTYETDFVRCLQDCVKNVADNTDKTNILMFHQDIAEVIPTSTISAYDPLFSKFDYIFDGHLHNHKRLTHKFALPGSLIVSSVNDLQTDHKKGFFHVSTSPNKPVSATFVPHTYKYPVFKDVPFNSPIPPEYKGQFIRRYKEIDDIKLPTDAVGALASREEMVDAYCKTEEHDETVKHKLQELINQLQLVDHSSTAIDFKYVDIEGFRSVVPSVRFTYETLRNNINYVIGDVGSGKTSVLIEALIWCLYGKIQRDPKNQGGGVKNIIPYEHTQTAKYRGTRIQVCFRTGGYDYLVARHLKYKGDTLSIKGGDRLLIFRKDAAEEEFTYDHVLDLDKVVTVEEYPYLSDMPAKSRNTKQLEIILGVSYKIFVKSIIFDLSGANLITSSSGELSDMLEQLLNASWIDELKVLASAKYKEYQEEYSQLHLTHSTKVAKYQSIEASKKLFYNLISEFEDTKQKALTTFKQDLNTKRSELVQVTQNIRETCKNKSAIVIEDVKDKEAYTNKLSVASTTLNKVRKFVEKQTKETELERVRSETNTKVIQFNQQLQTLQDKIDDKLSLIVPVSKTVSTLLVEKEQASAQLQTLRELEQQYKLLGQKHETAKLNVATAQKDIENANAVKCHECDQVRPVDPVKIAELESVLTVAKQFKETAYADYIALGFPDKVKEMTELDQKIQRITTEIVATRQEDQERTVLQHEIHELRIKYVTIESTRDKLISDLQKKEIEVNAFVQTIDYTYDDPTELIRTGTLEIQRINSELTTLEEFNDKVKKDTEKKAKLKRDLEGLNQQQRELSNDIKRLVSDIKDKFDEEVSPSIKTNLSNAEAQLIEIGQEVAEGQQSLDEVQSLIDTYKTISSDICSKKGLKNFIISNKLKALNENCIDYAQYSNIVVEVQVDSSSRYKIVVYKDGYTAPACNLSGGESTTANLSLICALHDTVQESTGIPIMLLDEPFNHVRETNADVIQDILEIKANKGTNMFIITHLQDISNEYQKILFLKDNLGHTTFELS